MNNEKVIPLLLLVLVSAARADPKCSDEIKFMKSLVCLAEDPVRTDPELSYHTYAVTLRDGSTGDKLVVRVNNRATPELAEKTAKRKSHIHLLQSEFTLPIHFGEENNQEGPLLEWMKEYTGLTPKAVYDQYFKHVDRLAGLKAIERIVKGALAVSDKDLAFTRLQPETWGQGQRSEDLLLLIDYDNIDKIGTMTSPDPDPRFVDPSFLPEGQKMGPAIEAVNVYSFGVFLYMILHDDEAPFKGTDEAWTGDYFISAGVDMELAFIIHECLRVDRQQRLSFQDVDEFIRTAQRNPEPKRLQERTKMWVHEQFPLSDADWIKENRIREFGLDSPTAKLHRKQERLAKGVGATKTIIVVVASSFLALLVLVVLFLLFCTGKEVRKMSGEANLASEALKEGHAQDTEAGNTAENVIDRPLN